jgi:hypothetical protein
MTTRTLPSDDAIDRACDAVLDGADHDAFFDGDAFAAELALVAGELTAAAAAPAPLPAALRARLLQQIDEQFDPQLDPQLDPQSDRSIDRAPARTPASTSTSGALSTSGATKTRSAPSKKAMPWARNASAAWAVAAAAAVLAVVGWWPRATPTDPTDPTPTVTVAPQEPTLAERRALLLTQAGTTTLAFGATEDVAARGASGDVVWNNTTQTGFMRIRGLARNQATIEQYQLWIFDAARDDRYPVDGGVFDIDGDDVIVAIHAAIDVRTPALFAVTVEKPGGVVVSDRSRIVLAAKVG